MHKNISLTTKYIYSHTLTYILNLTRAWVLNTQGLHIHSQNSRTTGKKSFVGKNLGKCWKPKAYKMEWRCIWEKPQDKIWIPVLRMSTKPYKLRIYFYLKTTLEHWRNNASQGTYLREVLSYWAKQLIFFLTIQALFLHSFFWCLRVFKTLLYFLKKIINSRKEKMKS